MEVPHAGLYEWLRSRWPRAVRDSPVGETDNLYIDLNSIVHAHAHPAAPTEEETVRSVLHHVKCLLDLVRPRRLFLAVDGVNDQRALHLAASGHAVDAPVPAAPAAVAAAASATAREEWDANAIAQGTEFMHKLLCGLKQIATQQGIAAVVSGPDVAGEGEHKIAQFIREQRRAPGYDPKSHHCLVGNETDLVMLGLAAHEPHFTVVHCDRDNGGSLSWIDLAALRECLWGTAVPNMPLALLSPVNPVLGEKVDSSLLSDEFAGIISVDHPSGQDNRVDIPSGSISMLQVMYQGGYGVINMRVFSSGSLVAPAKSYSHGNFGAGWMASDFGGSVINAQGNFDAVQFGYQGGYGIVNVRLHTAGASGQDWGGWMTPITGAIEFTSDALIGRSLHSIYTWRQNRYGIVDARSCVNI
eukprot:m51a1_g11188 putative 5 -3 exoribonuclease 1 (414) ;mRNA; r:24605-28498